MQALKNTTPDFTGQELFIGIDLGTKSWTTCIMTKHMEHKTFTQPPDPNVLINYIHRNFPGATVRCAYEAGYSGFWVHEHLCAAQMECTVVNPADIPSTNRDTAFKNNSIDARKIARALRNGDLHGVYVPSRTAQEDRSLVRTRAQTVNKQTRCKNQIKALLAFYGIHICAEFVRSHWSGRYLAYLEQLQLTTNSGSRALHILLSELQFLRTTITHLTTQIRALATTPPYQRPVECLVSIPGISTLTAMILMTELIDIRRFASLDYLASYCGLVPGEHSTGETETNTGISSRRNTLLRHIIIEAAWVAARKDPALLVAFTSFAKRMPKNKAIIKIARKLLNRIRFVLLHQQEYQSSVVEGI